MTPEEPVNPPDESAADDGDALDQDALDALIASDGADPSAVESTRPNRLLDQEELDALLEAEASKPPPKRAPMPTGERPPIEREAIRDQGILKGLLGSFYREPRASGPAAPSSSTRDGEKREPLVNQEELDAFLEAEANRPEAPPNAELMAGERPPIEKDEISDPEIMRALMGPYREGAASPEETGASETGEHDGEAMNQDALDALLAGELDSIPDEEGVERAADTPEDDSSEAMDQEALDALLSGGISYDEASAADASEEGSVENDSAAMDQAALDALIEATVPKEDDRAVADDAASTGEAEARPAATDQREGLLDQADVEAMVEAQAARPKRPSEGLPTGPRPRVLKERVGRRGNAEGTPWPLLRRVRGSCR